jgi:hypothetical protein
MLTLAGWNGAYRIAYNMLHRWIGGGGPPILNARIWIIADNDPLSRQQYALIRKEPPSIREDKSSERPLGHIYLCNRDVSRHGVCYTNYGEIFSASGQRIGPSSSKAMPQCDLSIRKVRRYNNLVSYSVFLHIHGHVLTKTSLTRNPSAAQELYYRSSKIKSTA